MAGASGSWGDPITGPWSSGSYGTAGIFQGEIVSINDPLRRNRVQVRVFGYQDDKGTIPDSKLSWYAVAQQNSQLKGAGSSHNYYPGSKVMLVPMGTELIVIGATAGFDSLKRKAGGTNGQSKEPDVPQTAQGSGKTQAMATDGQGKDTVNHGFNPQTNKPFEEPQEKKAYDDSKQKAPFDRGQPAKFADLMSIGIEKLVHGEDVLSKIKGMDGNASGAIKSAIDIITNLRKNGFGNSNQTIGKGNIQAAAKQFVSDFGAQPTIDILALIKELAACYRILRDATPLTIKTMSTDGTLIRCISALKPTVFNVSTAITDAMTETQINLAASPSIDGAPLLESLKSNYYHGVQQAIAAVGDYLNTLAAQAGGPSGLIKMFKDPQNFCDLCSEMLALGQMIGMNMESLKPMGQGAVGTALTQGVSGVSQAASSGSSSSNDVVQKLTAALNMFQNNPVALSEMKSGQINPESLLKIPLKYAQKKTNDPQKKFAPN